jgi:GTP-binding protein Era
MNETIATEPAATDYRCGTLAIVGRPNVGKSTLLNALVGAHLSITAAKPQTTRHRILGVRSDPAGQLVLVDTPGLHHSAKRALNRQINQVAKSALADVDAVMWVIDANRFNDEDALVERLVMAADKPLIVVLNQVDRIADKENLLPQIAELAKRLPQAQIVPISALKRNGIEQLVKVALALLPQQAAYFEADTLTDRSERFLAAEYVREQLIRRLGEELPYASTVTIDRFQMDGTMRRIDATVWVEREGQKVIVIGDKGAKLKDVGTNARKRMEAQFDGKVFLTLWVKVKADWSDSDAALAQLGYHDN